MLAREVQGANTSWGKLLCVIWHKYLTTMGGYGYRRVVCTRCRKRTTVWDF